MEKSSLDMPRARPLPRRSTVSWLRFILPEHSVRSCVLHKQDEGGFAVLRLPTCLV